MSFALYRKEPHASHIAYEQRLIYVQRVTRLVGSIQLIQRLAVYLMSLVQPVLFLSTSAARFWHLATDRGTASSLWMILK